MYRDTIRGIDLYVKYRETVTYGIGDGHLKTGHKSSRPTPPTKCINLLNHGNVLTLNQRTGGPGHVTWAVILSLRNFKCQGIFVKSSLLNATTFDLIDFAFHPTKLTIVRRLMSL